MNMSNMPKGKMVMMPAQPTQDVAAPMSTPTAPGIGPSPGIKANAAARGTHNPENALPGNAFHKRLPPA